MYVLFCFSGFLAGNVFDWGAKEVALLMESGSLNFEAAVEHIGPRPWLIDHVDQWVDRLRGPPHKEPSQQTILTSAVISVVDTE